MIEYKECPKMDAMKENENKHKNKKCLEKIWFKKNLLLIITLVGVLLGVILGISLRKLDLSETTILLISYPGELYMRLLKLLILPLIISSLITGSSSVDARLNGKIALRTFVYFFLTSCFNALLGVILAIVIHPGSLDIKILLNKEEANRASSVMDNLLDLGRNVFTDNIFQATFQQAHTDLVNTTLNFYIKDNGTYTVTNKMERILNYRLGTNNIGIVFFCILFGIILGTIGSRGNVLKDLFSAIFEVIMKMVRGVIWITPFGLCSIITGKIISVTNITLVMTQLGWFIFTIILGVFIYQLIFLQLIYFFIVRKNPFKFYLSFTQGTLTAFATASTAAALPSNIDTLDYELKIHPFVTRFVMPIGCNINMDGTAMFLAMATVFMAQISGFNLETGTFITIWFTSTIMSFSSASVPSTALILLYMIISSIGIPVKDLPLLFAVDWLVDRFRTTNNMLGDCYSTAIIAKLSQNELKEYSSQLTEIYKHEDISEKILLKSEDDPQVV